MDCVPAGCDGASVLDALLYMKTHTHEPTSVYPYLGEDGYCNYTGSLGTVMVTKINGVTP